MKILLIITNFNRWMYWRKVKRGVLTRDFKRGCGYYITVGLLGYDPIGEVQELEMQSGKIGLYKLIDYKTFRDPWDMIDESWWHFVGYKGQKPIKECSFSEFLAYFK
ncbi:MAG: hypothetical protein WC220_12495 [Pedobacter sp.]